jgi:endonuclease YncB( thermonuclease family)
VRRVSVIRQLLFALLVLLIGVSPLNAAEVLQVRTPSLLQVGDRNRTYTVALPCISVPENSKGEAVEWLRQQLPRRQRVNLRPVGSSDGQLLARVIPIGSEIDLSSGLIAAGLASDSCSGEAA